jgi:hypothetical protein
MLLQTFMYVQIFCGNMCFLFILGKYLGVELRSYGESVVNLLRLTKLFSKSAYTILYSHEECMRVPFSSLFTSAY